MERSFLPRRIVLPIVPDYLWQNAVTAFRDSKSNDLSAAARGAQAEQLNTLQTVVLVFPTLVKKRIMVKPHG